MTAARRALVLACIAVAAATSWVGHASAQDQGGEAATAAEVASLAREAITDDQALEQLQAITVVDGRPVDLAAVTADLGPDREERLGLLAEQFSATGGGAATPTDEDRELAEQVLDGRKYEDQQLPKPFKGALEWLTDRLRPVGRAFEPVWDLVQAVPGGGFILLGLLAAGLGWLVWWATDRRSRAVVASVASSRLVDLDQDPAELERQADASEANGDHALTVRLRYEAGLIRLVGAGRLVLRPDTTAASAAAQVSEPVLDRLTATFEEVVYGGRQATAADASQSRVGWLELVGAGARR